MAEDAGTDVEGAPEAGEAPGLLDRRIPHAVAGYVAASWAIVECVGFFETRYAWSAVAVEWTLVFLVAGFLPALVLTWRHGLPGVQRFTRVELALALACFLVVLGVGSRWVPPEGNPGEHAAPLQLRLEATPAELARLVGGWFRVPVRIDGAVPREPVDVSFEGVDLVRAAAILDRLEGVRAELADGSLRLFATAGEDEPVRLTVQVESARLFDVGQVVAGAAGLGLSVAEAVAERAVTLDAKDQPLPAILAALREQAKVRVAVVAGVLEIRPFGEESLSRAISLHSRSQTVHRMLMVLGVFAKVPVVCGWPRPPPRVQVTLEDATLEASLEILERQVDGVGKLRSGVLVFHPSRLPLPRDAALAVLAQGISPETLLAEVARLYHLRLDPAALGGASHMVSVKMDARHGLDDLLRAMGMLTGRKLRVSEGAIVGVARPSAPKP